MSFLPQRELSHAAYAVLSPDHAPLLSTSCAALYHGHAHFGTVNASAFEVFRLLRFFLVFVVVCFPSLSCLLSPSPSLSLSCWCLAFICLQLTLQHATCATFLCALSCSIWHFLLVCIFFIFSLRWFFFFLARLLSFFSRCLRHPQCVSLFISFVRSRCFCFGLCFSFCF